MTLTISQLQQMYGTKNVQELKGANSNAAPKNAGDVDVLERSAANSPTEIIPDDDNPLFMTIEQRALAHQHEEMRLRKAESERAQAEHAKMMEGIYKEQAAFEAMTFEEKVAYSEQKLQKMAEGAIKHRIEREAKIEVLRASLPPRIAGALGEDLRLNDAYTAKEANFLEQMKVKYAAVKDALSLPDEEIKDLAVRHAVGDFRIDPQQIAEEKRLQNLSAAEVAAEMKQKAGNSFVLGLNGTFNEIKVFAERIDHNRTMLQTAQRDLNAGSSRPFLREQIAEHQRNIDESIPKLDYWLKYLKDNTDSRGVQEEISSFFADYMQFHTGKTYNLNALYREAGLA